MTEAIPFPSPPLAGAGFILRPFVADDYRAANASREHPETREWVNGLPQPAAKEMVRFLEDLRLRGRLLHLAIADPESGSFLGEVLLFVRTPEAGETGIGEIAYVVAPEARGRGIAPQAVRLLSDWAFAELPLERLQLSIHPNNGASRRVAEKTGYTYEGTLRSTKLIRGSRVDSMLFSRLREDARVRQPL